MNKKKYKNSEKMNNKGWVRIAEAFVSVLIVIGAAVLVINGGLQRDDVSEKIYDAEIGILREIQLDESLRSEILGTSGIIDWNDFPSQIKNKIINETPDGLECSAKICTPESFCLLGEESEENIYAHSTLIFSTLTNYNPKIIKLFCNY